MTELRTLVEATEVKVAADPGRAQIRYTVTGTSDDGVSSEIRIGRHTVRSDEPPALGGVDAAPSPVQLALAGLLSCQVVTYRVWAAKLNIPLDHIDVEVVGALDVHGFLGFDESVRPGFGDIAVTVTLTGPAEPQRYEELAAAVDAHCPVLDLFRNPTPVAVVVSTAARQDGSHE